MILGENLLLIIGIDEYNHPSLPKLRNAKNDLTRFAKVLSERYGYQLASPEIFDGAATRENILEALHELADYANASDRIIIYFAGHGLIDQNSSVGYWIPVDKNLNRSKYIYNHDVITIIRGIKARHVLLISDSCYSGTFITQTAGSDSRHLLHENPEYKRSRWVFVSGEETPVSDGKEGHGSPFANALNESLEKNEADVLRLRDLIVKVTDLVKERTKKQQPQAAVIAGTGNDGGELFFHLKETDAILRSRRLAKKNRFAINELYQIDYYLPRTVSSINNSKPSIFLIFDDHEDSGTKLTEIIPLQKRIVLLGNAGSGKSIDLYQAAKSISEYGDGLAVYKRFNTYVDENIEDFLPSYWREAGSESLTVFLDGLDEIPPQHFITAIRKLTKFAEEYAQIGIVVSCRTNFYELPTSGFSGTLEGFGAYRINDISLSQIKAYVQDIVGGDGQKFIEELYEARLIDIVSKPFFLSILVKHYAKHGNFNSSRAEIIEEALFSYQLNNKQHYKSTGVVLDRNTAFPIMERIAFVMEVLGRNFVTDTELRAIVPLQVDFEKCKYLPAFRRDSTKDEWSFEHNNIQEFLAANVLIREPFERIVDVISIPFAGERRIKPTWVNTISFLISIGQKFSDIVGNLLQWIVQNDVEILVRFEPDRIDLGRRVDVFKEIFNFYSNKGIWLRSNKFTDSELARFAESEEVVRFLVEEIESNSQNRIKALNAFRILERIQIANYPAYVPRIQIALESLLVQLKQNPEDVYSILATAGRMKIVNRPLVELAVTEFGNHLSQYLRAGLYKLLANSDFLSEYISVFLDGLNLGELDSAINDRETFSLLDETYALIAGLIKPTDGSTLTKIIRALNHGQINLYNDDYSKVLTSVVQNSIGTVGVYPMLFEEMVNSLIMNSKNYRRDSVKILSDFFYQTGTAGKTLVFVYNDDRLTRHERDECLRGLLSNSTLLNLIAAYHEGLLTNEAILEVHDFLLWDREPSSETDAQLTLIEKATIEKGDKKPERREKKNWKEINLKKSQGEFDILFSNEKILIGIKAVFREMKTTIVARDELFKLYRSSGILQESSRHSTVVLDLLNEIGFETGIIQYKQVLRWIIFDQGFSYYRLRQIVRYLNNVQELIVGESQTQFIIEHCQYGNIEYDVLWDLVFRFNMRLPEEKLKRLTLYYNSNLETDVTQPGTIEQLLKLCNQDSIEQQVIQNLKEEIPSLLFASNAGYALRNQIAESYTIIIGKLESSKDYEYKYEELLKLWFKTTKNLDRLRTFVERAINDTLVKEGIFMLEEIGDIKWVKTHLKTALQQETGGDEEESLWSASRLISLNDFEGFEFIADNILAHQDPTFEFRTYLYSLPRFNDIRALEKLMKLLYLSKQPKFRQDRFEEFTSLVLDSLFAIGIISEENFIEVKDAIIQFVEEHQSEFGDLQFLHFHIVRMEEQINLGKSQRFSVSDALELFTSISKK